MGHCYEPAKWGFLGLIPQVWCGVERYFAEVAAGEATAVDECLAAYRGLVWSLARRSRQTSPTRKTPFRKSYRDLAERCALR